MVKLKKMAGKKLQSNGKIITGKYKIITLPSQPNIDKETRLANYKSGLIKPKRVQEVGNLLMLSETYGLNLILRQLAGNTIYPINIDSAGIGTGTTAPTSADTGLQTPVVTGIERSTANVDNDTLITEWFITDDSLPNGTYNEFALFCNGRIFARSIISPAYVKSSYEDTLVEYTIKISNS